MNYGNRKTTLHVLFLEDGEMKSTVQSLTKFEVCDWVDFLLDKGTPNLIVTKIREIQIS